MDEGGAAHFLTVTVTWEQYTRRGQNTRDLLHMAYTLVL